MKLLLFFFVSSPTAFVIITARSLSHTGSKHVLSIRMEEDFSRENPQHGNTYDPEIVRLFPEIFHPDVAPEQRAWETPAQIPHPSYAFYQSQPLLSHQSDGSYATTMGPNWPEFDAGARYEGTSVIKRDGEFIPPVQPIDWNAYPYGEFSFADLGMDLDADLAPVAGPQLVAGSYSETIPQQVTARSTTDFVSAKEQPQITFKGKSRTPPLPEGVRFVEGGEYIEGLGWPVIARNGKILYMGRTGNLRDKSKHSYNADGVRFNKRAGTLIKDTRKKQGGPGQSKAGQKRGDPIGDIETIESSSSTGITTTQSQSNQISQYLNTYHVIQANVSSLLYPFVKGIIGNTNNTLIRDVAATAFIEIVGLPIIVSSPFVAGMNCLGWLEEDYFRGTNSSVAAITAKPRSNLSSDDIASLHYFSSYQTLLSVYNNVYYNGSKVANSTGLLDVLHQLQRYLTPNDMSIMPEEFKKAKNMTQLFP